MILALSAWAAYQHGREWIAAANEKITTVTANAGMRVNDVYLLGHKEISTDQLRDKVNVALGTPLLSVDTAAVQARLMELPPVHRARVTRLWPDRLLVQIEERVPVALWQKDGKFAPIDRDGVALTYQHTETLTALPVIVGDGAPKVTNDLLSALEQYPELKSQLRGATWVSGRRWDLFLKTGMLIKLPEGDIRTGLKRLMKFADEHLIFAKPLAVVDLRLDDRVVVKPLPSAAPNELKPDAKPKQQI